MTRTKRLSVEEKRYREFDRQMLRASMVSLFAAAIQRRRENDRFTFQALADALGKHKSEISRWFSSEPPNWTLNTIADLASALDMDVEVRARERATGAVISPSGREQQAHFEEVPSAHKPKVTAGDGTHSFFTVLSDDYAETSSAGAGR